MTGYRMVASDREGCTVDVREFDNMAQVCGLLAHWLDDYALIEVRDKADRKLVIVASARGELTG